MTFYDRYRYRPPRPQLRFGGPGPIPICDIVPQVMQSIRQRSALLSTGPTSPQLTLGLFRPPGWPSSS